MYRGDNKCIEEGTITRKGGVTNFLAIVHEIAGKEKAELVRSNFGGANIYIGRRDAKVTANYCLRGYLSDEHIFRVRQKYLELEDRLMVGYIRISNSYSPGVLKRRSKREQIIEMLDKGSYSMVDIINEVNCTRQHYGEVFREYNHNKIIPKVGRMNIINLLYNFLEKDDTESYAYDDTVRIIRQALTTLNLIYKNLSSESHKIANCLEFIIQCIFDQAKDMGIITKNESRYWNEILENDYMSEKKSSRKKSSRKKSRKRKRD